MPTTLVVRLLWSLSIWPEAVEKTAKREARGQEGDLGVMKRPNQVWPPLVLICLAPVIASAQTPLVEQGGGSFRVQCPTATNPSKLQVLAPDALAKAPITDYKWIIGQDLTVHIDPACQVNTGTGARPRGSNGLPCPAGLPQTPATQFHTSCMPVIAKGCTGPQSCARWQTVYDAGIPCLSANNPVGCSNTAGQHVVAACDGYGICTVGATQLPASFPFDR